MGIRAWHYVPTKDVDESGSIICSEPRTLHLTITEDLDESITTFKKILDRALNCWPEAPAEWKELSDRLNHGKVLQDYSDPKYASIKRANLKE